MEGNKNADQNLEISSQTQADFALLKRGAVDVLPTEAFLQKLESSRRNKKPLIIKAGFDPTAPDLHLGHTVLLRKLKHFQQLGHDVLFLIGDFTGMIGDPTGRNETRKRLTREAVAANAQTYKKQVFKILDEAKTKIVFNSEWLQNMSFEEVLGLTARSTVAQLLERDDFSKRYKAGESISLIEFMYPLIQGYDSVAMHADVELGGTDQKFNLLVGRELQGQYGQPQQTVITMPLLVGLDGQRKMSKSYGNYIGIEDAPFDMFAKLMGVSDDLMWDYYLLLTDLPESEIEDLKKDPLEAKKKLGQTIVGEYHGDPVGIDCKKQWDAQKQQKDTLVLPPNTPELEVESGRHSLTSLITNAGLAKSTSEVRRLIQQGSIKQGQNLEIIEDVNAELEFPGEYTLKIGKKRFLILKGK